MLKKNLLLIITFLCFFSCANFKETHYFKDKVEYNPLDPSSLVSNYYKVEIQGYSLLSSSRYLSGYFDQRAVNEYFNEIKQPENAKFIKSNNVDNNKGEINFGENSSELVLIFSTNSEAIATQIKNTAENQDILKSLTLLANKSELENVERIKSQLNDLNTEISLFKLKTLNYIENINTEGDAISMKNDVDNLYLFVKDELLKKGVDASKLDDFNTIKAWYEKNQ